MSSPITRISEWDADKLERAAKYMRELDRSKNASAAIELARREQDVEMARQAALGKQADAARVSESANVERVRWDEQRKTIEFKNKHEMSKIDYQLRGEQDLLRHKDQLSRKRDEEGRRAALEDERIKVAIRRQAGRCSRVLQIHQYCHPEFCTSLHEQRKSSKPYAENQRSTGRSLTVKICVLEPLLRLRVALRSSVSMKTSLLVLLCRD